jgi:mannose-6-phosphate isomerase-like protein (cupin superfamily)
MRVGDEAPYPVGPGDTVSIPKHTPQQITNSGHEDLCFLCICTPKYSQECYTSLE